MRRSLDLKKETLAELSVDELVAVAGGAESQSCPITYSCVSCNCFNSFGCINIGRVGC